MLSSKIKYIFLFIFMLTIFLFVSFYFRVFFISPPIIIYDFENNDNLVVETEKYLLSGKAPNIKKFYLNGQEIFLDKDYNFQKNLYLQKNQNIFHIKAISKTGPILEKKIIIYKK